MPLVFYCRRPRTAAVIRTKLMLPPKKVEIPAFDPGNRSIRPCLEPLGMHASAEVEGLLSLLPPGNTLQAQLIQRGEIPAIVNQGVNLSYRVEDDLLALNGKTSTSGVMLPRWMCSHPKRSAFPSSQNRGSIPIR